MSQHNLTLTSDFAAPLLANVNAAFAAVASTSYGPTAPPNPREGQQWIRSTDNRWQIYLGGVWRRVNVTIT